MERSDVPGFLKSVIPVYRIAHIFALVPPYSCGKGIKLIMYRCVGFLLSIVASVTHGVIFRLKSNNAYHEQNAVVAFLDTIAVAIVTTAMVVTMFRSALGSVIANFNQLSMLFIEIENIFNSKKITSSIQWKTYVEIVFAHIATFSLYAYDAYVWVNAVGFNFYYPYIWHYICHYCNMVIVLLMLNYIQALRNCFSKTNGNLKCLRVYSTLYSRNAMLRGMEEVKNIRKIYSQLSVLVEIFNDIFGWPMLILSAIVLLSTLEVVNFVLIATWHKTFIENVTLNSEFIIVVSLWCVLLTIMGGAVTAACYTTKKEARRTAAICYTLLLDFSAMSTNTHQKMFREELVLLTQQATHQGPDFSAAGFFAVDCKIIFGLLGTITSYIIVLTQIYK